MPTSHTRTTIYNLAIDLIGDQPVASPLDTTNPYCRWLNRNYVHAVETTLRKQPWNFAIELHELNSAVDTPAYRWAYFYDLPNGWLRVLPPTYQGEPRGRPLDYAVQSNRLLMNEGPTQRIALVMNRQEPGEWDPLFASVIAATLANGMAHKFTQKASFTQLTKQAVLDAMAEAEEANAFEGTIDQPDEFDIIRVRYDTAHTGRGFR